MRPIILMTIFLAFTSLKIKAQTATANGKTLFENNCARCHGTDGTKGRWGAKNLRTTALNSSDLFNVISNGRGIMPQWRNRLDRQQILQIIDHLKTLRDR